MIKKLSTPLPNWERGACRSLDPDLFYLDDDAKGDVPNPVALAACNRCEIAAACLHWAMTNEKHGVWGGTTPRQREKIRRPIIRVSCPGCFSIAILEEPTSETCLSCGLSWKI